MGMYRIKTLLIKCCAHDRSSSRMGLMNTFKKIFTLDADSLSEIKTPDELFEYFGYTHACTVHTRTHEIYLHAGLDKSEITLRAQSTLF
jgi:hypothetical protein